VVHQIQRTLAGPFTGTFVCCFIKDHVNRYLSLHLGEDVFGNVNEIAAQLTFIPFGEGLRKFFIRKGKTTFSKA
jgi:hypothetical protein